MRLTESLRGDYERLFATCAIRPTRTAEVDRLVRSLETNGRRYQAVQSQLGVPWYFVAVIHNMEADQRFDRHLHNGDPLTARTTHVPAGRPRTGSPPFSWEESAADALSMKGLDADTDWSLPGCLYQIERYNGWGYRSFHPSVPSPYLWSFSTHYSSGKYVSDGRWSDTAVSQQCGAAVLLRRAVELALIEFGDQPAPLASDEPLVSRHSNRKPRDPIMVARAEDLQHWLNTFPGIFLRADGVPGDRTSAAYQRVTGNFLPGDPRGR